MNGGDKVSGKRGMSLLVKTMKEIQIKAFLQCENVMFRELFAKVGQLQSRMGDSKGRYQWKGC